MPGAFVPDCKADGSWKDMQCWGSTGFCWCVNEYGEKIPGSEGEDRGPVECGNGKDKISKKVERWSSEIIEILDDNMNRATQLTKRVSKMADKTVNYYKKINCYKPMAKKRIQDFNPYSSIVTSYSKNLFTVLCPI